MEIKNVGLILFHVILSFSVQYGANNNRATLQPDVNNIFLTAIEEENDYTTRGVSLSEHMTSRKQYDVSTIPFHNSEEDPCSKYGSCIKPPEATSWYCNCDEQCVDFNDCCLGHNTTQRASRKTYECLKRSISLKVGFFAISVCPVGYKNSSITEKCGQENIVEYGPPVVHKQNITFKNKYCALCHKVSDFVPFDVQLQQLTETELKLFKNVTNISIFEFLFDRGRYELIPPINAELRSCFVNLVENDHPLCKQYINPRVHVAYGTVTFYRNYFCKTAAPISKCLGQVINTFTHVDNIYALSVIFSFRDTASEVTDTMTCYKWTEKMYENNQCTHLETYKNYEVNVEHFLLSRISLTDEDAFRFGLITVWSLIIPNFTGLNNELIYVRINKAKTLAKVSFGLTVFKRCFKNELDRIKEAIYQRKLNIIVRDVENTTQKIYIIQGSQELTTGFENFTNFKYQILYRVYIDNNDILFDTMLDKEINRSSHNVKLIPDSMTIEVLRTPDNVLHIDSVVYQNDNRQDADKISALSILTYVCFSVSILALNGLIIYNRKLNLTTTIPGSNLENLSVSLLVSNLIFMLGIGANRIAMLCYVIGVILHYLWLGVFSFVTIAVLYIVRHLVQMKSRQLVSKDRLARKRLVITVIGLLIPSIFVCPAVVVDIYGPPYFSPGYGGKVCFPNQYPSNVIFFSGPIIASVAVDFVCLMHIICQICRVRLEMRHIRRSSSYKDAGIYLRIVVLSGFFWITGILAAVVESEVLDYLFTILCGLQGVFVALANLTTVRTRCFERPASSNGLEFRSKETKSSTATT